MIKQANRIGKKIRYAVVGLGWIAQESVLPAFIHAQENCELTAIFSDDEVKLKKIGEKYKVPYRCFYEEYDSFLKMGFVDAVYIALPNSMHCDFTVRAARAGVHVLCEKPMAVTESECRKMIRFCQQYQVKLMIAYRLHFEESNLNAVHLVNQKKLGDISVFNSTFTMPVKESDIRLDKELGGGTLFDIGIYCINASRYLFRKNPIEVMAFSVKDKKRKEVDQMTGALLKFPDDQLASFVTSFSAYSTSIYQIVGNKGTLKVEPAYNHNSSSTHIIEIDRKKEHKSFSKRDQFAPLLVYFADCILNGKEPEPSGQEGLIDVHIINAIYESARRRKAIKIRKIFDNKHPNREQMILKNRIKIPDLVHARSPKK